MKKLALTITRTLSFFTFGLILAGCLNLIQNETLDNKNLMIVTGLVVTFSLGMLVLNIISASQIFDSPYLSEIVPTKLIGANLSLTALLLTAGVATFIVVMKVQPSENVYTVMYALMGALSLPQSITNIGLRFTTRTRN